MYSLFFELIVNIVLNNKWLYDKLYNLFVRLFIFLIIINCKQEISVGMLKDRILSIAVLSLFIVLGKLLFISFSFTLLVILLAINAYIFVHIHLIDIEFEYKYPILYLVLNWLCVIVIIISIFLLLLKWNGLYKMSPFDGSNPGQPSGGGSNGSPGPNKPNNGGPSDVTAVGSTKKRKSPEELKAARRKYAKDYYERNKMVDTPYTQSRWSAIRKNDKIIFDIEKKNVTWKFLKRLYIEEKDLKNGYLEKRS